MAESAPDTSWAKEEGHDEENAALTSSDGEGGAPGAGGDHGTSAGIGSAGADGSGVVAGQIRRFRKSPQERCTIPAPRGAVSTGSFVSSNSSPSYQASCYLSASVLPSSTAEPRGYRSF